MGTSKSSEGPNAGVPFDPPWLDELGDDDTPDSQEPAESGDEDSPPSESVDVSPPEVAPPARFQQARLAIGKYARESLGRDGFRKAAGHYSGTGMGGAGRLAGRMRHSASTGSKMAHFLGDVSRRSDGDTARWVDQIISEDLTNEQVIDRIIQQVAPSSGSRDEESCAQSMAQAMSEFLEENETADLLDLEEFEIREVTERFMANEAYNRLMNDIGQVFESEKLSAQQALKVCEEMRTYLREDMSVELAGLWETNSNPSQSQLSTILTESIQRTFEIYESEI